MIDLKNMSAEEKEKLKKQLATEEMEAKEKIRKEREEYKQLVEEMVTKHFEKLKEASEVLRRTKTEIFEEFSTLINIKGELYGVSDKQASHTFTTKSGISIVVGYRTVDSFDDTVHVGIEKIKKYLKNLVSGEKVVIEEILNTLLKKDKNGNMRANRVLELRNIAEKINDEEFTDGVRIIEESYKPLKTRTFIDCYFKDEKTGEKKYVPLNMTGV